MARPTRRRVRRLAVLALVVGGLAVLRQTKLAENTRQTGPSGRPSDGSVS